MALVLDQNLVVAFVQVVDQEAYFLGVPFLEAQLLDLAFLVVVLAFLVVVVVLDLAYLVVVLV